jgi:hypothetical protein
MAERVGFGSIPRIELSEVTHFTKQSKRQNNPKHRFELHDWYTKAVCRLDCREQGYCFLLSVHPAIMIRRDVCYKLLFLGSCRLQLPFPSNEAPRDTTWISCCVQPYSHITTNGENQLMQMVNPTRFEPDVRRHRQQAVYWRDRRGLCRRCWLKQLRDKHPLDSLR